MSSNTPSPINLKRSQGWVKEFDDDGNMYLYNPTTDESKWPSPVKRSQFSGGLPEGWMALEDNDGNVYYYHEQSGEVTWDRPGASNANTPAPVSPISGQKLPRGWAREVDPDTQHKYYYNHETDESQWNTPKKSASMREDFETKGRSTGKKSLEPGWENATDPETGERYYYNATTDESQWDTPKRSSTPKPGWESAIDPETGEKYWFNPETYESQWNTPKKTPNQKGRTPTKSPFNSMESILEKEGGESPSKMSPVPPSSGKPREVDPETQKEIEAERLSEEERVAFKFEKMKKGGTVLRVSEDFNDPGTVWQMWQAQGHGAIFYSIEDMRGGQWKVPKVFQGFRDGKAPAATESKDSKQRLYVDTSVGSRGRDNRDRKSRDEGLPTPGTDTWTGTQGFADSRLGRAAGLADERGVGAEEWDQAKSAEALVAKEMEKQMRLKEAREQQQREGLDESTPSKAMTRHLRPQTASARKAKEKESELKREYAALQDNAGGGVFGEDRRIPLKNVERDLEQSSNRAKGAKKRWKEYMGPPLFSGHDDSENDWLNEREADGDRDEEDDEDDAYASDPAVMAYRESLRDGRDAVGAGYGSDDSDFGDSGAVGESAKRILRSEVVNRVQLDKEASQRQQRAREEKEKEREAARDRSKDSLTEDSLRAMSSRAVVIQQRWPWSRLVDMRSDVVFYENEETGAFQQEVPPEFSTVDSQLGIKLNPGEVDVAYDDFVDDQDEEDKEMRRINRALNSKGKKKSLRRENGGAAGSGGASQTAKGMRYKPPPSSKKLDLPSRRGGNKSLDAIEAGELERDVDSRFKEEIFARSPEKVREEEDYYSPTEADRFLRNDFSSLRVLSAHGRNKSHASEKEHHRRHVHHYVKPSSDRSIYTHKVERRDFEAKYSPPSGIDETAIRYTLDRAAAQAGHRSGMLFLVSKKKWADRRGRAAEEEFNRSEGVGHMGLRGLVKGLSLGDSEDQIKKTPTPDEMQQEYAEELLDRLRRLATETLQPGFDEGAEDGGQQKKNQTEGPNLAMDQDAEFLRARQSHERQFQLNEMRNKEKSIAELLSIQTESMDALYPTFIENEMNRRYLLEAAVLQRGKLMMPRTIRQSKALPKLADLYKSTHLLDTDDISSLGASHEVTSASDGCWTVYKIVSDHASLRDTTVFFNNKTRVAQPGEPLDLRCRRSRDSFREEKWSLMGRYLPKASVITRHGIKLLSDPDGGLLYYNPMLDRYSSSDVFDDHVSNSHIMETIRRRETIRAEIKAADLDRYGRSMSAPAKDRSTDTPTKKKHSRETKRHSVANVEAAAATKAAIESAGADDADYFLEHPDLVKEKLSGYRHAIDASIERDILEYPETNIWVGILLPKGHVKPAADKSGARGNGGKKGIKKTPALETLASGPESVDVTPRNLAPTRDLNSPSAGVTPGPLDGAFSREAPVGTSNTPFGAGFDNDSHSAVQSTAISFVNNISIHPNGDTGREVRPFSAGGDTFGAEAQMTGTVMGIAERPSTAPTSGQSQGYSESKNDAEDQSSASSALEEPGALNVSNVVGKSAMSKLIKEQQNTLANAGPPVLRASLTQAISPDAILPPIAYEEEMDHTTYAEYRDIIQKIAAEPRNPVLLLRLSSFLYTKKMDHACMAGLDRTLEVLEDWNLTGESSAMLRILRSKVGVRVYGKYADLADMKDHAVTCKDSPTILSQVAMYFNRLKYIEQAEQLYIAALLIDPLHAEANRGYAHILIQKSNYQAANRYFVRVYSHSLCYSIVKAEQGWLQEMQGADDEAIMLAFKKCLSLGNRDRGTVCALYSLGHFFHVRKDFGKAVDFYRRSLMYDPNEFETLLLLGCLGNSLPQGQKSYSKFQIDAWMRRGLLMQQRGASRWVALMIYAESLIANFGDFDRAEMYLWQAVTDSYSKEIWAVVSLAHYYQYTLCRPGRAKRLLLWSAKSRSKAASLKVKADPHNVVHNRLYESGGIGLDRASDSGFGSGIAFRDGINSSASEAEAADTKREGENFFRMKMHGEEAVLHVAVAYSCMDAKNFTGARSHAEKALALDPDLGPAHRCMGLLLYRNRSTRKESLKHFNECLDLCGGQAMLEAGGGNEHSLRTCAVIMSMEGSYSKALQYMRLATAAVDTVQPLSWRALATMTYLYQEGTPKERIRESITYLGRAMSLSNDEDTEAMVMAGQLYMELGQPVNAREYFQKAMTLTPSDPILLSSLALCLAAIGFRSPLSATQADYDARFKDMRSLGELCAIEDPELLLQVAANPLIEASIRASTSGGGASGSHDPTVDRDLPRSQRKLSLMQSAIVKDEPAEIETSAKDKKIPAPAKEGETSDVAPDVLYWCGMHHMQQKGSASLDKAREFFLRAVQRADHPPHPLALYMLGWLSELKGDLKAAERYYCYALQLEPIDSLYFLRLKKLSKDTLSYVKGLAKTAEKGEVHRKRVLKKKNKLRRRGVSVPVGFEADETGELAAALTTMRKRMLLHERVYKLAIMRKEQLGKRLVGLNVPGKCLSLDPFWQERLLHAFTECDDWASLLRSSNVYKKA